MDEQELEAALKKLEERALDLRAMNQEHAPDWTELEGLVERLPADSEQRRTLEWTLLSLKTTSVHNETLIDLKAGEALMLQSVFGLHRRVVALEEMVTNLADRVSELETEID